MAKSSKDIQIKPLSDRVLLKAIEKNNVTDSGIYIPETTSKEKPYMYEVIAVWPGKKVDGKVEKIDLKPGEKVLSWQYSWDDIKLDGIEYKIVWIEYILAKVD